MVFAIMIPSGVYASEKNIVYVGYDGLHSYQGKVYNVETDYELETTTFKVLDSKMEDVQFDFSVSNVLEVYDASNIFYGLNPGIVVEPNAKVTLLSKSLLIFEAYKINAIEANDIKFDYELAVEGSFVVPVNEGKLDEEGNEIYTDKIISASELLENGAEGGMAWHSVGNTVTLTEPGKYLINARHEAAAGSATAFIEVGAKDTNTSDDTKVVEPTASPIEVVNTEVIASPSNSLILVNGENTSLNAYNIGGNNYFKLRDIATVVDASEKQFQVQWDKEVSAINLVSGQSYTPVGGEKALGDGLVKKALLSKSKIYMDGDEIQLTAYNIDGNNYFKLRDVAQVFDIGIGWDGQTQTIEIDTTTGYIAD